MYEWGVNSIVTKHSDYFVWKDTSERVTRRCDDTVDKERANTCVLKGVQQPKKLPKTPGNPTRYCHVFIIGWRRKQKKTVFWNRASHSFNSFINSNWFGIKILITSFLHWGKTICSDMNHNHVDSSADPALKVIACLTLFIITLV